MKTARLALAIAALATLGFIVWCAANEASAPRGADSRLDQKVTMKALGSPLDQFLAELSAKTGVRMVAIHGAGDLKLCAFVKDVPLGQLQDAIAKVLRLHISPVRKSGELQYEFRQSADLEQEIEALKAGEYTTLHASIDRSVKELRDFDAHGGDELTRRYGSVSEKQYRSFLAANPELKGVQFMLSPSNTLAIEAYAALSQDERTALWKGKSIQVGMESLPSVVGRKLQDRFADQQHEYQVMREFADRCGSHPSTREHLKPHHLELTGFSLRLEPADDTRKPSIDYNPEYRDPQAAGRHPSNVFTGFIDAPAVGLWAGEDLSRAQDRPGAGSRSTAGICFDPDESRADNCYAIMEALSYKYGLCVVSDYFTYLAAPNTGLLTHAPNEPRPKYASAEDVLDEMGRQVGLSIARLGRTSLVTSGVWYKDRGREIPARLVERWVKAKKKHGGLRLQELMETTCLTQTQIADLPLYKTLGMQYGIGQSIEALRLVRMLSPGQWRQAEGKSGLPIANLSYAQFPLALDWAQHPMLSDSHDPERQYRSREGLRNCALRINRANLARVVLCDRTIMPSASSEGNAQPSGKPKSVDPDTQCIWEFQILPPPPPPEVFRRMEHEFRETVRARLAKKGVPIPSNFNPDSAAFNRWMEDLNHRIAFADVEPPLMMAGKDPYVQSGQVSYARLSLAELNSQGRWDRSGQRHLASRAMAQRGM